MKNRIIWLILALFFPLTIHAETVSPALDPISDNLAKFYFAINGSSFFDPNFFYADIKMNTASSTVNAASLSFSFDTSKLELQSSTLNPEICKFKIFENLDQEKGTYALLCATDKALQTSSSTLTSLQFTKKQSGKANIQIEPGSAFYSANGLGERIPTLPETHNIYLIK